MKQNRKGFTLAELLIVVAIVAVLVAFVCGILAGMITGQIGRAYVVKLEPRSI